MMALKILTVIGARPQFIKAAPVSNALAARDDMNEVLVHTGQHFDADMSDVFFSELGIPAPHHTLEIHGGGHGEMTGRMLVALEQVMLHEKPDLVLIYGDTNSTLAGAVAAAKLYIPVAHVEAGLRSFQQMPEEINRIVADRLSHWLFCPTDTAVANLAKEGVTEGVHLVGDVMFDATVRIREQARETSTILADLGLKSKGFQVATLHRAENTDTAQALTTALDYLKAAARTCPVVLPLHPRTRAAAERFGLNFDGLMIVRPVGYVDMAALLDGCVQVLTDSGGLQKEAYFHGKPCITLRDATEWTETVDAGWNRLWHTEEFRPRRPINAYGRGDTALRIIEILARGD